jgi:selenocysteine lyase/cysteine desulfurase
VHGAVYKRCKERVAALIGSGATADEVAFCGSTSHAIGTVATGIEWQDGDNCVLADGEVSRERGAVEDTCYTATTSTCA